MISLFFQTLPQTAVESVLNSLPAGVLIAFFAWALLRVLPRQNSRTRFAVWFVSLAAVVSLPWLPDLLRTRLSGPIFGDSSNGLSIISLPIHWATFLFAVWLAAASVFVVRLGFGVWRLHQLRQTCKPIDPASLGSSLSELVGQLTSRDSLARPVSIAVSDQVGVPTAIGLWKPMIVLPEWALRELSISELSVIIHHELAHLRHWDDWTNLFQKLVRAVFFFHPAVWWIEQHLSVEREMACDDVVIAETGNPMGYASCLVSLLERSLAQRGWTMAQAIVHRAREASMRLARILDPARPIAVRVSRPALGLAGAFATLCFVLLPNTPQVVSFGQKAQPAAEQFSAAATETPVIPSSMIHNADWHGSSLPASAIPASFKTQPSAPRAKASRFISKDSAEIAATKSVSRDEILGPELASDLLAERSFMAAVSNLSFDETFFASQEAQRNSPVLVVMQATEFAVPATPPNGTTRPLVWRVQVWRVSVVNATWKSKAVVSPAHST